MQIILNNPTRTVLVLAFIVAGLTQDVLAQQPPLPSAPSLNQAPSPGAGAPPQQQAGRLIKIPLIRGITPAVGSFGQPVISYYAPVHIGTPAKTFNIQFDVGYTESFVPHYTWNPFKVNLHYGKGFLCKESSTCEKTNREYTSECQNNVITGKPYEDLVGFSSAYREMAGAQNHSSIHSPAIGHFSPPLRPIAFQQNFLAASDASDAKFRYLPVDGYFGLSPGYQSSAGAIRNPVASMHGAHLIDNLQFSFWFNPVLDSNQGGELVLGGVDTNRYQGQIFWHHLNQVNPNYWTINLQQVLLGGQPIGCNSAEAFSCQATISSAVNEVYGPQDQVKRIYDLLNTVKSSSGDLQLLDCRRIGQLPVLTLYVDGIPYSLLPSNYIRKTTDQTAFKSGTCYVAIMPLAGRQSSGHWILGTNFLGAYYSVYDLTYRQVGFASLR